MQYLMHFKKTIDDYIFTYDGSAGDVDVPGNDYVLSRKGILESVTTQYSVRSEYKCDFVKESEKRATFSWLYNRAQSFAENDYNGLKADYDKRKNNRKF